MQKADRTEAGRTTGFLINFSKLNDLYAVAKIELYGGNNMLVSRIVRKKFPLSPR